MEVALVKVEGTGKVLQFTTGGIDVEVGGHCIVEGERGLEFGDVVSETKMIPDSKAIKSLRRVVRIATEGDMQRREENGKREKEAFRICTQRIEERQISMKLVQAKYSFDGNRITFCFTAEGRVDFRELVKDLAQIFKTRIELRQIGVRDEAKILGGTGRCGRPLCCATFLKSFGPVTIRMARDQNLPLNPSKLSGPCGRLMCCLMYEQEVYREMRKHLPKKGSKVRTERGIGKVIDFNIIKQTVTVEFDEGQEIEYTAEKLRSRRGL